MLFVAGGWLPAILIIAANIIFGRGVPPDVSHQLYPFNIWALYSQIPVRHDYIIAVDIDGAQRFVIDDDLLGTTDQDLFRYVVQEFGRTATSSPDTALLSRIESMMPDAYRGFTLYRVQSDPIEEYTTGKRDLTRIADFTFPDRSNL